MIAGMGGCGEGGQHPAVVEALEAMRNVRSFSFSEHGASRIVPISTHKYVVGTTGTFQSPDRLSKRIDMQRGVSEEPIAVELLREGDAQFFWEPVTQDWFPYYEDRRADDNETMDIFFVSPADTLHRVLAQSGRFRAHRGEDIMDGVRTRRLSWRTDLGRTIERTINVFIGTEDSLVRKLVIRDSWTKTEGPCPTWSCSDNLIHDPGSSEYTLEFSFPGDEAPIITPPRERDIVSSPVGPMALWPYGPIQEQLCPLFHSVSRGVEASRTAIRRRRPLGSAVPRNRISLQGSLHHHAVCRRHRVQV